MSWVYWTNFAKHGNPNGPGLDEWPAFTCEHPQVLRIDSTIRVDGVANLDKLEAIETFFAEARKSSLAAMAPAQLKVASVPAEVSPPAVGAN